jgi:hypothetical protein
MGARLQLEKRKENKILKFEELGWKKWNHCRIKQPLWFTTWILAPSRKTGSD